MGGENNDMNSRQIELVQQSFSKVQPIAVEAARLFYQRLFELDPSLRPMFRGDIEEQGRKLMQIIGVAVGSLRQWDRIAPAVEEMGQRHAGYGVRDEHYGTVATALLWTLEQGLGKEQFTDEVRDAWIAMYGMVTEAMQRGAAVAVPV
jgi:hemoglobin-like flavoprotein